MTDDGFSRALVLYLGYGRRPSPHADPDALGSPAGYDTTGMVSRIQTRLTDLHTAYSYTWNDHLELDEVAALLTTDLTTRYPDLTDEAIAALVWTWTFEAWH